MTFDIPYEKEHEITVGNLTMSFRARVWPRDAENPQEVEIGEVKVVSPPGTVIEVEDLSGSTIHRLMCEKAIEEARE